MKLPGHKELSLQGGLNEYLKPSKVYIQYNKDYEVMVEKGNKVLIGTILAYKNTKFELPILSPVSGIISEIRDNLIIINNDFKEETLNKPLKINTKEEFVKLLKDNGLIGMSGSGFPTYVKFNTDKKINNLLVNVIECEPYITADYTLVKYFAKDILDGINEILKINNIDKSIIAVKETNQEIIDILNKENTYKNIIIKTVKNYYPAGYKKNIMYDTLGISYEGRSSDVGVIECNVHTIYAIYNILRYNKPVTERIVTFTGESLNIPKNYLVKIGTNVKEIIDLIGTKEDTYDIIEGGAMMGEHHTEDIIPITMAINNILVINFEEDICTNCIRCGKCTSVCPAKLSPVLIKDNLRNKEYLEKLDPNRCIGCGLCSYVCPAKINVREYVKKAKLVLKGGK